MDFYWESSFMYGFVFFCGVILGSFLNSWIWRAWENIRIIMGRSMCINCRRPLAWYENIPLLSYAVLKGRCRTCHFPIPRHYPAVEFGMGILLLVVFTLHIHGPVFNLVTFWRDIFFTTLLVIIFVYDALYMIILPRIVWLGAIIGGVCNYFFLHQPLRSLLIGAAVGGGFFLAQFIISKGRWIGGGDVRFGFLMGIWLGFPGVVPALFIAYVTGAIVALVLLAARRKTWQAQIHFGTFLALGTFLSLCFGSQLIDWYLHFLHS
jgi:prepilin signal peptidase PulO-like enzyme (type II secretory pathway)